jgi:tRNA pseudouridine55 synthase
MLGVVNLDKPVGPTSHDMVALMRRLTGMRRVGHAGTLDPLASGVLPILVGAATRFSRDLAAGDKRYEAVVRLGWRSVTDDAQGPIERGGPLPADDELPEAVAAFVGTFEQRPPAFSARKVGGRSAHRLARRGEQVELPARAVTVHAIDLLGVERDMDRIDLRLDLRCGPGTYVRSIARDLGERLGSGGHLAELRRTAVGSLLAEDAVTPDRLESLAGEGRLATALMAVGDLLPLPHLQLDAAETLRFRHGSTVPLHGSDGPGRHAVYSDGALLGIGRVEGSLLKPETVIGDEPG